MIKAHTHPLSYLCTATFILFLLPQSIHAQTDMTREERIKILEALKESDTILEKSISGSQLPETQHYIEGFDLPPLSVFMDAVIENATVKRAQSQVEQVKNQYRIEKRNWWNYFRLNGNYAYGRYNVLNDNSDSYNDWYQSTTASSRYTFNVGASFSVGLGDLFNRPLRLKNYRYNIEQLQYTQEEVMEERRLKVLEAYNNVTAQLATIKAKAENAALYNAQMKISENNFIQGKIDIISLSLERARRSGAVTSYAEARVSLHNAIILLEMLTNVKIIARRYIQALSLIFRGCSVPWHNFSIDSVRGMNKPPVRFLQPEQVQKHQQERVRNPTNRFQQTPFPIFAGNGESQRQQQQYEYPPPFTGRRRREQGMCEGNYEHKAQQQHSGKRDLLIKLIAEVPLPAANGR